MPSKGLTVELYDGQNQFKVPFMLYEDFEAILEPIQERVPGDPTSEVNQHIPSGWCVYSKFAYGEVEAPLELYRGEDCVEKFFATTSKRKLAGCTTCSQRNPWIP